MLIDCHIHMSYPSAKAKEESFRAAREAGAAAFVAVAINADDARQIVEMAESTRDLYCGVGVHPRQLQTYSREDLNRFRNLIKRNKKIVCIGETGLDYEGPLFGPPLSEADRAKQRDMFRDMVRLAKEVGLPLNMHSDRPSSQDLLKVLEEEKAYEVGGMMHNFQASVEQAREYLDMGFYTSASVTIHHPMANRLRGVIKDVPLGQMVMDSDSPGYRVPRAGYEGPFPYDMDKKSEPIMIRYIADKLAEIKGIQVSEVEALTSLNARRLFRLPA